MKNRLFLFLFIFHLSLLAQEPFKKLDSVFQAIDVGIEDSAIIDSTALKTNKKQAELPPKVIHETLKVTVYDTIHKTILENPRQKTSEENKNQAISPLKTLGQFLSFSKIIWTFFIFLFTYYLLKIVSIIINRWSEKAPKKSIFLKKLLPFIKLIGWILAIFLVEQAVIQLPGETLFALLASAGIAIGFAAQDMLKNIFGGIMIIFDRPFQIGDKIEVGEYYGEVKEIGLRSTRIQTPDDSLVSIPNAEVVNKAVSNANAGENNCQVVAEIFLPADIDTKLVRKIAIETAQTSRYIYLNKPISILFFHEKNEHKTYLKVRIKAYVSNLKDEFAFKSDMTEIFLQELYKRSILKSTNN